MEQLTQAQLAELIRAGYKKHNLKETNADYYDEETHAACPIFAAYSFFFESAEEADSDLGLLPSNFNRDMATRINAPFDLVQAVSNLHDNDSAAQVQDTLLLLDLGAFPV